MPKGPGTYGSKLGRPPKPPKPRQKKIVGGLLAKLAKNKPKTDKEKKIHKAVMDAARSKRAAGGSLKHPGPVRREYIPGDPKGHWRVKSPYKKPPGGKGKSPRTTQSRKPKRHHSR